MANDITHTVFIEWESGTEIVRLNLSSIYEPGQRIETVERWPDLDEALVYKVTVEWHAIDGSLHELRLAYTQAANEGAAEHNEAWGHSILKLDVNEQTAEAFWSDDKPDWSGPGRAVLVPEAMFVAVQYENAARIKRDQVAFRAAMEVVYGGRCALTGETCFDLLDAAHIVEVKTRGGSGTTNGILLRTDLHRLFDRNLLAIDASGSAVLSPDAKVLPSYRESLSDLRMQEALFKAIKPALKARQALVKKQKIQAQSYRS